MAHIVIFVTNSVGVSEGNLQVNGYAKLSDDNQVDWSATIPASTGATAWNEACRDAAIASAEAGGSVIGPGDNKIIIGAAVAV